MRYQGEVEWHWDLWCFGLSIGRMSKHERTCNCGNDPDCWCDWNGQWWGIAFVLGPVTLFTGVVV